MNFKLQEFTTKRTDSDSSPKLPSILTMFDIPSPAIDFSSFLTKRDLSPAMDPNGLLLQLNKVKNELEILKAETKKETQMHENQIQYLKNQLEKKDKEIEHLKSAASKKNIENDSEELRRFNKDIFLSKKQLKKNNKLAIQEKQSKTAKKDRAVMKLNTTDPMLLFKTNKIKAKDYSQEDLNSYAKMVILNEKSIKEVLILAQNKIPRSTLRDRINMLKSIRKTF